MLVNTRLNERTKAEFMEELKNWLDENGPSITNDIANGLAWTYHFTNKLLRMKPDWLVSPGYITERYAKIVLYASSGEHALGQCTKCNVRNFHHGARFRDICVKCSMGKEKKVVEYGFTEEELAHIDPWKPCEYPPDTIEKLMTLAKRYADGVPLWNKDDADWGANPAPAFADDGCDISDDWD